MTRDELSKVLIQALFLIGKADEPEQVCFHRKTFLKFVETVGQILRPELRFEQLDDERIGYSNPKKTEGLRARGQITPTRWFNMANPQGPDEVSSELLTVVDAIEKHFSTDDDLLSRASIDGNKIGMALPDPSAIVPMLKTDAMIEGMNKRSSNMISEAGGKNGDAYAYINWQFLGRVRVVLAFDMPTNFIFIDRAMLSDMGMSEEEVKEKALDNLRAKAGRIKFRTDYGKAPVKIDRLDGNASALLLLDSFWQKEAVKAKDELVIHVEDYDILKVVRKSDKTALAQLLIEIAMRRINSVFPPPILFVYATDGMRLLTEADLK